MQPKSAPKSEESKPKVGRPKTNPLSRKEQVRLRMQELRARKRDQQGLVSIEIWIPETLKAKFQGEDLSAAAQEAFELLASKRGY